MMLLSFFFYISNKKLIQKSFKSKLQILHFIQKTDQLQIRNITKTNTNNKDINNSTLQLKQQKMSSLQRLTKLSQYLTDGNFQQAVYLYDKKIEVPQNQLEYLLLAKAYFIAEHYQTTLSLLREVQHSRNIPLLFQAKMLQLEALYLHSSFNPETLLKLEQFMQMNQNSFNDYHFHCLQQIKSIMQKQLGKKSNFASREILYDQKNEFLQVYKKYDNFSPIMQGMPVYLISKRWYDQWQQFVSFQSKVTGQNPGPITNFQIIDHIYQGFYDHRKQKSYTNNYLFEPCKYKIIPKQCWEFLYKRYGGIEVVRYNISDISKPNEIMTEVYLKKIAIVQKSKLDFLRVPNTLKDIVTFVQITRKETWKGLIHSKLQQAWGQNGTILELVDNQTKKIDLNQFLEDCDTTGKIYLYAQQQNNINFQKSSSEKCGNIKCIQTKNLRYCQCKSIKYCSMECLKQDRDRHRKKCQLQMQHIKQNSAISNFNLGEKQYGGRKGIVGLRNLGNTCYMNSGLQCLSNTKEITDYFMSNGFLKDINTSNPLGTKGNLACAYAELMREIWAGKDDVVSPFNLKKMIGKFATQFSGNGQQDSQEFISYLIDGLQQDLNLVKKKQTFETKDEIVPDEVASLQSERNYAKRIQSYIRDLMAGQFKSTVRCLKCKKISICFDPYLLLSLPIPPPRMMDFYLVSNDLSHGAIRFYFEIGETTTFKRLDSELKKYYKEINQIVYLKFNKETFQIEEIIQNLNDKLTFHHKQNVFVFGYEIPIQDGQSDIYFTEYFYQKGRWGFPRFLRFPKKSMQQTYQRVIDESMQRSTQKPYDINVENVQKLSPPALYDRICSNYLRVNLKRQIKLLTFRDNRDFEFTKEEGKGITLYDCLGNFSKTQILEKENEWYCGKCKEFVSAEKQLQIYKSNKILVLAFKRFSRMKKIKAFVDYPIEGLDMGPYLRGNKEKKPILYDLYGVVNHYGSLGGGHYTAFCQNFLNKKWYEFNDSRVSEISRRQIVSDSSYVLFFRRRE